jgi:ABC-type Fe3+ transport system permease subunit
MQATSEASLQAAPHRPATRESSRGAILLIVGMLGFSLIGLVAWAVAQSRSVSHTEAVEKRPARTDRNASWLWKIAVAFALLLTLAWCVGLVLLAIWLASSIF